MKVLLINGSPHQNGCTFTALSEVASALKNNGVETDFFHIGTKAIYGCTACGSCRKTGKCIFADDGVNHCAFLAKECDGLIVGSPVYYAGPNGALCAFLDRLFFSTAGSGAFTRKPAACVLSCRRGGASAAFDRLNKYFTISQMPVVSSQYWNAVHGTKPQDVKQDLEGLQIMRTLGNNMAWLLKSIKEGKAPLPEAEPRIATNFIR